jgi:Concanavalin A-like lectin/glucanases superfamily/Repeat of unknown function (DUF346)
MSNRALCLAFGGYADLDLTFGEFFNANHTVMTRFMPQFPYAGAGAMLAENGSGTYLIGQGDYRWGSGDLNLTGPSVLFVQVGNTRVTYDVPVFANQVGGPVGYRNVWQHLAVVRQGQTLRLFLNGKHLNGIESADLTIPTSGLPANSTPLRIARRTTAGSDESNLFWQFFGLIDDVAVFAKALTENEIKQAMNAALTGSETGLLAGYTFDTGSQSAQLSRPVHLPTASDIPEHVNVHAAHPVPVYYVNVSADRNSSQDSKKMDIRPSKVQATLPFGCGEWWHVTQGRENPGSSHNGGTAGFCSDFVRVNGVTFGSRVFAVAAGRVIEVDPDDAAMCVYHTTFERAVYMHLKDGCFAEGFPDYHGNPVDKSPAQQPTYGFRDHIADVGHNPNGDHLHFVTSAISGDIFAGAGPSLPNAITDYYVSADKGKTWNKVDLGVPQQDDMVARYPWSPWGDRGDAFDVAPAVASRAPDRLDIFVRGENDGLWHKTWNGQVWSDWEDLGGRLTSSPAAVSWGPDRLDVFVRGHDGQLAHKQWDSVQGWSEWRDLGGRLTSAPAAASWGPNRLDVFVSGHDNQLAQIRWNGDSWSEWRDLGGRLTSAPAAVSWGTNRIDVLVRGHEGQLAQKRWTDDKDWSDWRDLGGRLTSGPAVASWGADRLDVFVRGHDGQLAQMRWNGQDWSDWRDLGGRLTSGPGAVSWGPNRIDVFVRGHEYQLAQMRWAGDAGWSDWRNLDGN